jgi:hypothetical protein
MDDYSCRREVLVRIAELLEQMPEDVLLQLIQRWEIELNETLANDPNILRFDEPESSTSHSPSQCDGTTAQSTSIE